MANLSMGSSLRNLPKTAPQHLIAQCVVPSSTIASSIINRTFATGDDNNSDTTLISPTSSDEASADWRDLQLSDFDVTKAKNFDGGAKRIRKKKKGAESDIVLRPDVTGVQPSILPEADMKSLLEEAYGNIPERGGRQRKNHFRRQNVKYHIIRANYKIAAKQRAQSNSRKMEKRSRIAKECREMRALCHELYPEYNEGKIGNPNDNKKDYGWMRGRMKDQKIMRRRAEEEGVDVLERYERVQEEKRERREMGKSRA